MTIFYYYLEAIVYYKKIHVKENSNDSFKKHGNKGTQFRNSLSIPYIIEQFFHINKIYNIDII